MNCALRKCVYALLTGFFICSQSAEALCREDKENKIVTPANSNATSGVDNNGRFQWREHSKLSWDDFKGAVNAANAESAAATHCGIGFKTATGSAEGKPEIIVYNIFYTEKSWVRSDAKIPSILDHEQGHFDLCEIYTRRLRNRMTNFDFNVPDIMQALMSVYSEVNAEYETRQRAYEEETIHGTNTAQQKKWHDMITQELM
jgi:hypothetical protein